mgnify:CR=1 FL=1
MIRLRQVALVARDLDQVVGELCRTLGLSVCFHDPGVGEFGLHNALMVVGDQFIDDATGLGHHLVVIDLSVTR